MKNPISLFLTCVLIHMTAVAQPPAGVSYVDASTRTLILNDNIKRDIIGHAFMECAYEYSTTLDTLNTETPRRTQTMSLLIGDGVSRYCSFLTVISDSLVMNNEEAIPEKYIRQYTTREQAQVYKFPKDGRLVHTDMLAMYFYRYEEELEPQDWIVTDGTKEILGYECHSAECEYRGRRYIAWFAPAIPVSDGPWKFHGLPGLIMEVADDRGHYSFRITGIINSEDKPITLAKHSYFDVSRMVYLRDLRRYREDPRGFIPPPERSRNEREAAPFNTRRAGRVLNYDFLETDYR